jgi:photosystem II stability/assembly factor-like uncharacterized protein
MQRPSLAAIAAMVLSAAALHAQDAPVTSQPYVWKSVVIKANGFVNGVVFHPTERGLIYMNTDMGGAYRHDAAEGRWTCLTDWITNDDFSLNQMGVETIAVDPTDASRVYAGVGTYMGPSAVIRSGDRGATWERTNVPFPMDGNGSARQTGQRMNVDPNLPMRLLYGTRTMGLYESANRGATWTQVTAFPVVEEKQGPTRYAGVVWTLFDRASGIAGSATPTVYAGAMSQGGDRLFRSLDAGRTWALVPGFPGGDLQPNRAVLTPDGKTLYATFVVAGGYPGPHSLRGGSVYRIDNPAGESPTWTEIAPAKGGFAWSGVSIDPTDPRTLYVSTLCRYGDLGDDIYRSTDAGATWKALEINAHRDDSSAAYAKSMGMHWTGDVQVDPTNRDVAIFTTGFGLYRTTNLTADAPTWAFYNEGFEQVAALELFSPPAGPVPLFSAIGDRDGYRHENLDESPKYGLFGQPNDFGQTENLAMGTSGSVSAAWQDPNVLVRTGGTAQYSLDGGLTWKTFTPGLARNALQRPPAGGTIAISGDGTIVVWAPGGRRGQEPQALRRCTRSGDAWTAWEPVTGDFGARPRVVADLAASGTFYIRGGSGFFASADGGVTWQKMAGELPRNANWLRAVPGQTGHLFTAAGEEGLHRTIDGGQTWQRVAEGVVTVAKQVGIGAPPPGKDYPAVFVGGTVGGKPGFFRSDDQGVTWVQINDAAHHYGNVTVIQGDPRTFGRLYVGTNGRGILYADPK